MVRRDWCPLSKDVGNFALREILSAKPKEEVVAAIHDHLHKVCYLSDPQCKPKLLLCSCNVFHVLSRTALVPICC